MRPNGYMIKLINKELEANKNKDLKEFDLTAQQFHIIMFVSKNDDKKIFQKDLENDMDISAATCSGILSRMELKGYIKRVTLYGDSRFKYIELTQKALDIKDAVFKNIEKNEKRITLGFSDEEKNVLEDFLKRMLENLQNEENNI